jgi:phosphatidylserine/phosphatidylglycerophosphate/cardiolipin synthase-like enzyme
MIALDSITGFTSTLEHGRSIALTAYTLREGRVLRALEDAARGGADVRVRLERDPLDDASGTLHQANAASIAALRAAGAKAEATEPGEPVLHLK